MLMASRIVQLDLCGVIGAAMNVMVEANIEGNANLQAIIAHDKTNTI